MDIEVFTGDKRTGLATGITRVQTTQLAPDGQQYTVFILDCEDSLDLVVCYPNSEREIVWSLVKE
jgi:hypothetical protein